MADEEAFLQEIAANPEDDTPRLIFADWLEERGDSQAEFIRAQCAAARSMAGGSCPPGLQHREQELLRERRAASLAVLQTLGVRDIRFSRGFVDKIQCDGTRFL